MRLAYNIINLIVLTHKMLLNSPLFSVDCSMPIQGFSLKLLKTVRCEQTIVNEIPNYYYKNSIVLLEGWRVIYSFIV